MAEKSCPVARRRLVKVLARPPQTDVIRGAGEMRGDRCQTSYGDGLVVGTNSACRMLWGQTRAVVDERQRSATNGRRRPAAPWHPVPAGPRVPFRQTPLNISNEIGQARTGQLAAAERSRRDTRPTSSRIVRWEKTGVRAGP